MTRLVTAQERKKLDKFIQSHVPESTPPKPKAPKLPQDERPK